MLRTRNNTTATNSCIFSGIAWYYGDTYIVSQSREIKGHLTAQHLCRWQSKSSLVELNVAECRLFRFTIEYLKSVLNVGIDFNDAYPSSHIESVWYPILCVGMSDRYVHSVIYYMELYYNHSFFFPTGHCNQVHSSRGWSVWAGWQGASLPHALWMPEHVQGDETWSCGGATQRACVEAVRNSMEGT